MFFTFEGPEGSGKSTQIELLRKRLCDHGREVVKTFEPGGTDLGREVRRLLLHSAGMNEVSELLLYAADRAEHVRKIILPSVQRGAVVISDRYYHSTMAYQGYGRNIDTELIRKIMEIAVQGMEPDRIFLIDIPVEEGFKRINVMGREKDRIENEKLDFHIRIRQGYLDMAKNDSRFVVLDGTGDIGRIHEKIWEEVLSCL